MRPMKHRGPFGQGLNEVLPAEIGKAPANHRHVRYRVHLTEFAIGVEEREPLIGALATTAHGHAQPLQPLGDGIRSFQVARRPNILDMAQPGVS